MNKLVIKNRENKKEQISTVKNIEVLFNDKPLDGLKGISFEADAESQKVEVVLKLLTEVEIETKFLKFVNCDRDKEEVYLDFT